MPFNLRCCPVVDRFHCFSCKCSLKAATVRVGWIEAVASIIQLVWSSVCLLELKKTMHCCSFTKKHLRRIVEEHQFWLDSVDLYIPLVSQAAILCFCCLLLLFGAHNKKPICMIPYLVVCQLGIWLLVLVTVISGFSEIFTEFSTGLSIIMGGSILTVIVWYLWLIKYSYYQQLVEELRQSKAQKHVCPESPVMEQVTRIETGLPTDLCSHTDKI